MESSKCSTDLPFPTKEKQRSNESNLVFGLAGSFSSNAFLEGWTVALALVASKSFDELCGFDESAGGTLTPTGRVDPIGRGGGLFRGKPTEFGGRLVELTGWGVLWEAGELFSLFLDSGGGGALLSWFEVEVNWYDGLSGGLTGWGVGGLIGLVWGCGKYLGIDE